MYLLKQDQYGYESEDWHGLGAGYGDMGGGGFGDGYVSKELANGHGDGDGYGNAEGSGYGLVVSLTDRHLLIMLAVRTI